MANVEPCGTSKRYSQYGSSVSVVVGADVVEAVVAIGGDYDKISRTSFREKICDNLLWEPIAPSLESTWSIHGRRNLVSGERSTISLPIEDGASSIR
jgi:hypothetical protein